MISRVITMRAHMLGCAAAAAAALFIMGTAQAQVNPSVFQGMRWRNIGPFIAGKVDSVSGVEGRPAIAYVGTDNGGVWKTVNAGTTWFPVTDAVHVVRGITSLAVAPSQPSVVYAGTGSVFGSHYSSGVWKSTDAGAHWQSAGLKNAGEIAWLLVDPHNPDLVLAATRGIDHRKGGARGVFRSTDGGRTWTLVLNAQPQSGATYMSSASDDPRVIFATVAQTYTVPGASGLALFRHPGPTSLYKSTDEGLTWTKLEGRNQPKLIAETAVAAGTQSRRVYLLNRTGLYRSDDGGASWSLGTKTIYTSSKQLLVDPHDPNVVYTMGTCVYRSTDGGHTLVAFKGAPGGDDPNQWWIDPTDPNHIVYGGDQGASVSLDGGQTWSLWYNQKTAEIYKIGTDNRYPYWIYGSKQDSGAFAIASRGSVGEITDLDWFPLPGWETGFVAVDPAHPDIIFTNGPFGFLQKVNRKTWGAQIVDFGVGAISAVSDTDFRRAVSAPIVFSPQNPSLLYYGTQNVWESQDGGDHWRKISPDLTAHPGKPPLPNPEGVHHGDALVSLSPSTVQAGVIWTGSNNGVTYVTEDGGKHWRDITPPDTSIHAVIDIQASHFDPSEAYAAVENSASGDYSPHIYRTRDFGKSWQSIVMGLPSDQPTGSFVRVVREDHHKQGLLFAATETSVYVSFDDGNHWQSLRLNLPTTSFYDLEIHDRDLLAATYGRGIWILDDITPLEQLTAGLADQQMHLFRPQAAIRVQSNINQDTPFPPEVPHGKNPPQGVVIDYYLKQPARNVQLQIFDAKGNLVRSYSNAAITPLDQPLPPTPAFWARPLRPLPTTAGEHRVSWNMRYPTPPALFFDQSMGAVPEDTPFVPEGPMALPGDYTVKLTVDGVSYAQPVLLKQDPRLSDSPAAMEGMRRQLTLAQHVIAVMSASKNAYELGSGLDAKLTSLRAGVPNGLAKTLQKGIAKLTGTIKDASTGLSGGNYAVPAVKGATSFSRINGQASALLEMAESTSDQGPVPSLYRTYSELCRDFNATSAAWQSMQAKVARLNAGLKHADHGRGITFKPVSSLTCATHDASTDAGT
ncbi:MAG: WD40/YVTN/BNR-like repeat-containing protein [Steroidobacteraceae bacterium]